MHNFNDRCLFKYHRPLAVLLLASWHSLRCVLTLVSLQPPFCWPQWHLWTRHRTASVSDPALPPGPYHYALQPACRHLSGFSLGHTCNHIQCTATRTATNQKSSSLKRENLLMDTCLQFTISESSRSIWVDWPLIVSQFTLVHSCSDRKSVTVINDWLTESHRM